MKILFQIIFICLISFSALAVQPDEMLKDAQQEARAREISRHLRCLVCQGEDIDESQAPLAADLRRLVRERITAGDTDEAVLAYIRDRYGDYVLMKPPFSVKTALLWAAPFLVLLAGFFIVLRQGRKGAA